VVNLQQDLNANCCVCLLTELVKRWCVISSGMLSGYENEKVQQSGFGSWINSVFLLVSTGCGQKNVPRQKFDFLSNG